MPPDACIVSRFPIGGGFGGWVGLGGGPAWDGGWVGGARWGSSHSTLMHSHVHADGQHVYYTPYSPGGGGKHCSMYP